MKLKRELGSIDAMDVSTDLPRSKRRKRGSSAMSPTGNDVEMGEVEDGETSDKTDKTLVKEQGFQIYNTVVNTKGKDDRVLSYDFQHLPSKRMYADYYTLITEPIALDGIKAKLNRSGYPSLESVKRDFDTCFKNAKKYNMKDSQIYRDAKELHKAASDEYRSIVGPTNVDILGSGSDESDEDNYDDGDYEGGGKTKSPKGRRGRPISIIRLMRIRMQKLVEKTDEDGRLITEPFMELPDKKAYPIYYKTIKRLMCFDTILKRIKRKEYATMAQFAADVELVFTNALTFNEEHSPIWEDAMTLKTYFRELMSDLPPQFALPEYSLDAKPIPIQNGKLKLRVPAPSQIQPLSAAENVANGALKVKLPPLAAANAPIAAASAATTTTAAQPSSSAPVTRQQAAAKVARSPNITSQPLSTQTPAQPHTTTYLQPMTYPQLHPHQPQPQYQYHPHSVSMPQSTVNSISPSPLSSTPAPANMVFDHPLRSMILRTLPYGRTLRLDASEGVRTWVLRLSKDEIKVAIREVRFLEDESEEEGDEDESKSANTTNSGKGEIFVKANGVVVIAKIPNTKEGEGVWEVSELKPGVNTLEVGEQSGEIWKIVLQRPLVKT